MINRLIERSLRNRFLVVCAVLLVIGFGIQAVRQTPVDAIPDLSENQVIVFADWPGRSPQEVEDQVTYPLTVNLQGLAGVKTVRASSMFGFTFITVIFQDDVDNYFARTRVLERLNYLGDLLPSGVVPKLGPDATGWAGFINTTWRWTRRRPPKAVTTSPNCVRSRTGSSVISSTPCPASRRLAASAASCASIKLMSLPRA